MATAAIGASFTQIAPERIGVQRRPEPQADAPQPTRADQPVRQTGPDPLERPKDRLAPAAHAALLNVQEKSSGS